MAKNRKKSAETDRLQSSVEAFSFGDPIPVLDRADILSYLECYTQFDKWYQPPMSFEGLPKHF